ncbi:MAG: type II toxin-antitoxin system HipA family toxin [Gordonibacter sp.]|uniref:type II toxin-antitoxin system HipA family toxin n=1 Tax=Gordonibacter sp. TaxID=1968902 RepID=UPI002FCAA8DF
MIAAHVSLWGTRIGAVQQDGADDIPVFNYDPDFLRSGIELSPLEMPLSGAIYSFPALKGESFHGLPGMLADSLPDRFGNALLDSYLAQTGRDFKRLCAVERLLYTGTRGMGALEYEPSDDRFAYSGSIDIDALVSVANEVLGQREGIHETMDEAGLARLVSVGTSAGGARAKAVIAWNRETNDVRSGQVEADSGYEHWLIKFDDIMRNKDKGDSYDRPAYTRIEFAYYLMALEAGIEMSECRLLGESDRQHFMTRRFDRTASGGKLHMQTLGALAHFDFNHPAAQSYEQAASVMRHLNLGQDRIEQLYLRMLFNVSARNQDDHVKNLSFLMDRRGVWNLAPAYDVTYANDPGNKWLSRHQMTVAGKADNIGLDDLLAAAKAMDVSRSRALEMVEQVNEAISAWSTFAQQASVPERAYEEIARNLLAVR